MMTTDDCTIAWHDASAELCAAEASWPPSGGSTGLKRLILRGL